VPFHPAGCDRRAGLARAADEAAQAGILILSAREANDAPCWPGALPQVLGIRLDWEWPRAGYRPDGNGFAASGYPRPIPGVPQQRNLYGISFAVAQMSGFAALAVEHLGALPRSPARLASVREALAAEARRLTSA